MPVERSWSETGAVHCKVTLEMKFPIASRSVIARGCGRPALKPERSPTEAAPAVEEPTSWMEPVT